MWVFSNIWDILYQIIYWVAVVPLFVIKYLAMAHDWGAYFLSHYEEYLTSEFFTEFVWNRLVGNFLHVFVPLLWWGVVIMYFVFWPITFPITIVLGGIFWVWW